MLAQFYKFDWTQALDFVEFTAKNLESMSVFFCDHVNHYLEQENSAYRFVGKEIVEITSETEIRAIEDGMELGSNEIQAHLSAALKLLSDRRKPDFRNSVKESI